VAAGQVLEDGAALIEPDPRVPARDERILQGEVALHAAPDEEAPRRDHDVAGVVRQPGGHATGIPIAPPGVKSPRSHWGPAPSNPLNHDGGSPPQSWVERTRRKKTTVRGWATRP